MSFNLSLDFQGLFVYVPRIDSMTRALTSVTVLFVDGRRSSIASDGKTFIPSHVPVVQVPRKYVKKPLPPDVIQFLDDNDEPQCLWFLDCHDLSLQPDGGAELLIDRRERRIDPATGQPVIVPDYHVPGEEGQFYWVAEMKYIMGIQTSIRVSSARVRTQARFLRASISRRARSAAPATLKTLMATISLGTLRLSLKHRAQPSLITKR